MLSCDVGYPCIIKVPEALLNFEKNIDFLNSYLTLFSRQYFKYFYLFHFLFMLSPKTILQIVRGLFYFMLPQP